MGGSLSRASGGVPDPEVAGSAKHPCPSPIDGQLQVGTGEPALDELRARLIGGHHLGWDVLYDETDVAVGRLVARKTMGAWAERHVGRLLTWGSPSRQPQSATC